MLNIIHSLFLLCAQPLKKKIHKIFSLYKCSSYLCAASAFFYKAERSNTCSSRLSPCKLYVTFSRRLVLESGGKAVNQGDVVSGWVQVVFKRFFVRTLSKINPQSSIHAALKENIYVEAD